MRFAAEPEPITDDDNAIRAALNFADITSLLTSVAQLTGDLDLLRDEFRPNQAMLMQPDAGLSPEARRAARDAAAAALIAYRDSGCPPPAPLSLDDVRNMVEFIAGDAAVDDDYVSMLREELALDEDLRRPAPLERRFRVAVIGAGMSGIAAAHRLRQAGADVVVFEKNPDAGGTWFENVYPGCRVDVPNHLYSYSFAQTPDWSAFYSTQPELHAYFRACIDELDLGDCIRFGTEIDEVRFDEGTQQWQLAGERFDAVVSAVGQLNRPHYPEIDGLDSFAGASFHSARWDHEVPLRDRRVAIIGTGASAAQFIPIVAEQAAELVVFQRTPPWLIPTPNYHDPLPEGLAWVLRHVPGYARWDRLWVFWRMFEGIGPMARVDPAWEPKDRSVSAANDFLRQAFTAYLRGEFPDDALFEKVLPTYPPAAKRVVRDNGIWARTFTRPNVELVTDRIESITPAGVRTADGVERDFDVVIYGTGFHASKFLTPMRVIGRNGVDIHEQWDGEARAYLGMTVPGFPNFFMMYGPNTNLVINGSIIFFSENEAQYIVESLRMLASGGFRTMDCRPDVHDEYNERVDEANRQMAWGVSTVNTWYKNARGRVTQNWPFSMLEFWQRTRRPDPGDYVLA